MKRIILLLLLLTGFCSCAQFSKTHYIPPVSGTNSFSGIAEDQFLYISTPSVNPVNFRIIQLGGTIINATVSRSQPYVHSIGSGTQTQFHTPESAVNTVRSDKGYIIEADDLVYVSARMISGQQNQAGSIVSKGLAALGREFRVGAFLNTNVDNNQYGENHYTFVSVLATENNTTVTFSNIKPGTTLLNNQSAGNNPAPVVLNSGQSYVLAVKGSSNSVRDGLIGALVSSTKDIAVNCGSFTGSNASANLDLGFDQIVSSERTGTDYIFIKSAGQDIVERVLLIANDPGPTEIYLNGDPFFSYSLQQGEYVSIDGSAYDANGNLYVRSSQKVFAYQSVGDTSFAGWANQELFFVPPLRCETPHVIDNIPLIEKIGSRSFPGRITLVTKTGSTLTFNINGIDETLPSLSTLPGVTVNGPINVVGNLNYETFTIRGINGNIAAFSTSELYLAAYGTDQAATYGGFYSGFTTKPEVSFQLVNPTSADCIPNTRLSVNSLSPYDVFQWYFNGAAMPGETGSFILPTVPGYYLVNATISSCGTTYASDEIPVSICPGDLDNDNVDDNTDQDNDNDGVTNCTESYGDAKLNMAVTSLASYTINIPNYTNSYVQSIATNNSANTYNGNANGFYSTAAIGKGNYISSTIDFAQPVSIAIRYNEPVSPGFALADDSEFTLKCNPSQTVTVLNPNNQLLIDTNYDGIFESGVTKFSSFEIRFRRNSTVAIPPTGGSFSFNCYQATSISYTHKNLSDTADSKASFSLYLTCIPRDTDADGIFDQLDGDSDNDGILDALEAQGATYLPLSGNDVDGDGINDAYGSGLVPKDSDGDSVPDIVDLDSDNDGIYDLIESGSSASDSNLNGMIDGTSASFGSNGISNSIETLPDSGLINYTINDTDADGFYNYIETDSDGDGCDDTIEAGFPDANNDGILGNGTATINPLNGLINNATFGYTLPFNSNYIIAAPIAIVTQPANISICEGQSGTVSIVTNDPAVTYQWEVFYVGANVWTPIGIAQAANYSNYLTANLTFTNVPATLNTAIYRVKLSKPGNSCGLYSVEKTLTVLPMPIVADFTNLVQCDEDSLANGITNVNLKQQESIISAAYTTLDFTYYTSLTAATTQNAAQQILTPTMFNTGNTSVWARVQNADGCFSVSRIDIKINATNIPASFHRTLRTCDDFLTNNGNDSAANNDHDGISSFDFSSVTVDILATIPAGNYTVRYYKSASDASSETDIAGNSLEINNISNYRNIDYPGTQEIWVRVEIASENSCFALGNYLTLIVDPLPEMDMNAEFLFCQDSLLLSETIDAALAITENPADYIYEWTFNGGVLSGESNYDLDITTEGDYTVKVTSTQGCFRVREIKVIASNAANIQQIVVKDLSDENTVTVIASGEGNYVYSLDFPNAYQSSNIFNNVAPGLHTAYVKDLDGCGLVGPIDVAVLGAPKFFTPNADTYNDTWNLEGTYAGFNDQSEVKIFDRFGKFLKQIPPSGEGWDGTFNGNPLPADDYWYTILLEDGRVFKGHFALKR